MLHIFFKTEVISRNERSTHSINNQARSSKSQGIFFFLGGVHHAFDVLVNMWFLWLPQSMGRQYCFGSLLSFNWNFPQGKSKSSEITSGSLLLNFMDLYAYLIVFSYKVTLII